MSGMQNDNRWRVVAQTSAAVEQRPDGKYIASTKIGSFSIANTPREAVAELFDVPPCDVIGPANRDARVLAGAVHGIADNLAKQIRDKPNFSVVVQSADYLQIMRAFEACAEGRHDEALRRLADVTNFTADELRGMLK